MSVWVINDRPEHPVMREVLQRLSGDRRSRAVDPTDEAELARAYLDLRVARPSVMLLKSHDEAALGLGRQARELGVTVVNDPDATARCLDRELMALTAAAAGIAFPRTSGPFCLAAGPVGESSIRAALDEIGVGPGAQVLVKSRRSRRSDLVVCAAAESVAALANGWDGEQVVLQPAASFDGWDHKVWVVGERLFAVRRPSPAPQPGHSAMSGAGSDVEVVLPPDWVDLVRAVGLAYGLWVFGVDLLDTPNGPLVVDVNPFPGSRGGVGAAAAIAELAMAELAAAEPATAGATSRAE